ncbi:hypothetical protein [Sphingomonas sp. G-3-2-10]|uniref:hypothetical protein n=1 Tax=Sphingomonas sp. G-3-2-10 TaxID=2728838 RepID=UPI00146B7E7C|nr:hypothetical protein [Sphingomonas sp. G-3-2-10]NML07918.1 hypothetical protein [Sphingomonas sp. G-3-2-10]
MKLLLALASPLLLQTTTGAAWDIAPRWDCWATHLRICNGPGDCEVSDNAARFRVDFTTNRMFIGKDTKDPLASETIEVRYYWDGGSFGTGSTKLGLNSGDVLSIADKPKAGTTRYPMIVSRAAPDQQ